jgi:Protein of unknown function (DUF3574)
MSVARGRWPVLTSEKRRRFMKLSVVGLCSLLFGTGAVIGCAFTSQVVAQGPVVDVQCGATAASQLRTTLYFGLARPKGSVSELEWQVFLRDEVTTRFPEGLTVWEANGQWRRPDGEIDHERSKVLLLVHPDTATARGAVQAVIGRYRKKFEQESVLWESSRVCIAS